MITDAIIQVLGVAITAPLRLLPAGGVFPTQFTDTITMLFTEVSKWDKLFPISDIVIILGLFLSVEGGILGFQGINWVINKIRGSGG